MRGDDYRTQKQLRVYLDADDRRELNRLRLHVEQWHQREHLTVDEEHDQQHFLEVLNHILKHAK